MQVVPSTSFLPGLLHQQYLARGLMAAPPPSSAPTHRHTPPSSEDNMSPPPPMEAYRGKQQDEDLLDKVALRFLFVVCSCFSPQLSAYTLLDQQLIHICSYSCQQLSAALALAASRDVNNSRVFRSFHYFSQNPRSRI